MGLSVTLGVNVNAVLDRIAVNAKLKLIADGLDSAPRKGGVTDDPEGMRYIVISDTLAKSIVDVIRHASADPEVARATGVPIGTEYLDTE